MKNYNPLLGANDSEYRNQGFKKDLSQIKHLFDTNIINRALVLDVDRQGGLWRINRGGNGGQNDIISVDGTLKVRLLLNLLNTSDGSDETVFDIDEYYALPLNHNRIKYPRAGSVVKVMFDKPFDLGSNIVLYWIGEDTYFANRDYESTFKFRNAAHGKELLLSEDTIYGGTKPTVTDIDRDIKSVGISYEPYPEIFRKKAEDIVDTGSSNTKIHHSFSAHQDDDKRGYIEIGTEYDYIENMNVLTNFDYNTATSDEISAHQTMIVNHIKKFRDADVTTSNWEFLNSRGSRIIVATKLNTDARLISKDFSMDGTGKNSSLSGSWDVNYRDEGPGQNSINANGVNVGSEIEQSPIHDSISFNTLANDVTDVKSDARQPISFDESVPTLFLESSKIQIISRDGGNISHLPLGEPLIRWLQRLLITMLHQQRTNDILRDRLHKLAEDFNSHFHPLGGATLTLQPEGSASQPSFLQYTEIYTPTTDGSVGNDSGDFTENGSDSMDSSQIKNRISEERSDTITLIKELSSLLSTTHSIN